MIAPDHVSLGLRYTSGEVALRSSAFGFAAADEKNLDHIRFAIREDVRGIVDALGELLRATSALGPRGTDAHAIDHLADTHRRYVMTLGLDWQTIDYVEGRLRFAVDHMRAGVDYECCLAIYNKLFELVVPRLVAHRGEDTGHLGSVLVTLQRILAYDAQFAVEAYFEAHKSRHEKIVFDLAETQRKFVAEVRRDAVTQLDSRAFLLEMLDRELSRSGRFGHPFSILFIDVDHFKRVNDTLGHAGGDAALLRVAHIIRAAVRPADIVGRYGGDEILVGVVEADLETARGIAERIRRDVAAAWCKSDDGVRVTVSVGCASRVSDGEGLDELVAHADAAMYAAKAAGRDRIAPAYATPRGLIR
jgi:diguanylate cyclase (GGDEF)-like protein